MQQVTNSKAKKIQITIGIIVGVFMFGLIQFCINKPSLNKQLTSMANEMNKSCPMMVDKETRLDNAVVGPDDIFQYNYTLINIEKGQIDTDAVKNYIQPVVANNLKTNPDMKFQRDNKVSLKYYYKDKNGTYLFSLVVKPQD
jgi:hypothetical protein